MVLEWDERPDAQDDPIAGSGHPPRERLGDPLVDDRWPARQSVDPLHDPGHPLGVRREDGKAAVR